MPSFKINNWDLDVNKDKSAVSIKAHNTSNRSNFSKELTNEDIASEGFMLIDDIDDLYTSLTEGSKSCQEAIKLSISDDGHLTISQKVTQADREKVFNDEITLERIEKGEPEKTSETKEPKKSLLKKEKQSAKEHNFFYQKIAELEGEIKGLKTGYGNDLAEIKKLLEEQANRIKSLEEENANLKKSSEEAEKRGPASDFSFAPNPNFDVSNNGKRAISKTSEGHAILSTLPLIKGVTYSFRITTPPSNYHVFIGLVPENSRDPEDIFNEEGLFGYSNEGWTRLSRESPLQAFKNGDVVSFFLTDDGKAIYSINNQAVDTTELLSNLAKYQFLLSTRDSASIGAELLL